MVGKSADSIANQSGGWSLTWQGTDNSNADFPHADSVLAGIRDADGAAQITYSATAQGIDLKSYDAIIAVIGETPYAETMGDLIPSATLRHSDRYPEDLAVLQTVAAAGKPVVTVFLSGRPLYANDLLNHTDAFVAAWLPGTEGAGIADLLFASGAGQQAFNFTGTLAMRWPGVPCPDAEEATTAHWLFARGYGLRYPSHHELPPLPTHADVTACAKASTLAIFHTLALSPFALYLAEGKAGHTAHDVGADLNATVDWPATNPVLSLRTVQINTQQDAKSVTWRGPGRFFAQSPQAINLMPLMATHAALQFDLVIGTPARGAVQVYLGCGADCTSTIDVTRAIAAYAPGTRHTVSIPLRCFSKPGMDLTHVDVPFGVLATKPFAAAFADIRIAAGRTADAPCPAAAP